MSFAALTARMCCQREGPIKVTLLEMQLITASWRRQRKALRELYEGRAAAHGQNVIKM